MSSSPPASTCWSPASTPETVNPDTDAAEAARVPCLATVCPWEAFYFGRGATPDKPFTYTYLFFIRVEQLATVYTSLWLKGVQNNKSYGPTTPTATPCAPAQAGAGEGRPDGGRLQAPTWPTRSELLGMTSQQLTDAYEKATKRQWTQNLGTTAALMETRCTH